LRPRRRRRRKTAAEREARAASGSRCQLATGFSSEEREGRAGGAAGGDDLDAGGLGEGLELAFADVPGGEALLAFGGVGGGDFGDGARGSPGAGSTQGSMTWGAKLGKATRRLGRSPLTSIIKTGTRSRRASSTRTVRRPVLPLPVMPTTMA
jgi:hypothetical protein